MKKVLLIALLLILTSFTSKEGVDASFDSDASALGITIQDYYEPVDSFEYGFKHIESDYLWSNGLSAMQVEIDHALLEDNRDATYNIFAYRLVLDPGVGKRSCGFLYLKTCYDRTVYSDVIHVEAPLRTGHELKNWAPVTGVEDYSNTIGISAGTGGFDVSFSHTWSFSDIDVYSTSSTSSDTYHAVYNFVTESTYTENASIHYGAFTYQKTGTSYVDIEYDFYVFWHTNLGALGHGHIGSDRTYGDYEIPDYPWWYM